MEARLCWALRSQLAYSGSRSSSLVGSIFEASSSLLVWESREIKVIETATPALLEMLADQHCGGVYKVLGFFPGRTMGANDVHMRAGGADDSEMRKFLAARAPVYFEQRREKNRSAAESSRKRAAESSGGFAGSDVQN